MNEPIPTDGISIKDVFWWWTIALLAGLIWLLVIR